MGIILILIGIIIQRTLFKLKGDKKSNTFNHKSAIFMANPIVRMVLALISWGIIIAGMLRLLS